MGVKRALFDGAVRGVIRAFGLNGPSRAAAEFAARVEPVVTVSVEGRVLSFASSGSWPHYRATTLLTKEPETIQWLNSFQPGEVLYDIGANVGVYALYAALIRGCRVIACEPGAANYARLVRNIELNRVEDSITPLCVALTDRPGLGVLQMQTTEAGGSLAAFGEAIDQDERPFVPVFRQATMGMTLDGLAGLAGVPRPRHVKIDVDGFEDRVVEGAARTLQDARVASVLIEINEARRSWRQLIDRMTAWGYAASVTQRKANTSIHNYLFTRRVPEEASPAACVGACAPC